MGSLGRVHKECWIHDDHLQEIVQSVQIKESRKQLGIRPSEASGNDYVFVSGVRVCGVQCFHSSKLVAA